jgi:hypothetical protein
MDFNIKGKMKQLSNLFLAFLILNACNNQPREYPNVTTDQIGSFLEWGMNYASVKKILTEDFNLEFSKEIEQGGKNKIGKVYEFTGGKLNDVETEFWKVVIEQDSLVIIMVSILTENPEETKRDFNKLTAGFLRDIIKYPHEERWYFQKDGKRLSEIQIMKYPDDKGIFLTFFRPFEIVVE